ncbi:MAG: succinate dehydrogenase/fumarate reductase iron-sulfur subunit [Chloroflexota bacterium]
MPDLSVATLKVWRFDPKVDEKPYYQSYQVPVNPGMTVLQGLFYVTDRLDGSLSYRSCCRAGVCGSCAMFINGAYRLACETQIGWFPEGEITIGPLPRLKVIKDLVVDLEPFFAKYEQIKPYLINNSKPPEKERLQSPKDRRKLNETIDCILCASCYSSCPTVWMSEEEDGYLGPAALTKAWRFVADSRDEGTKERMEVVASEHGLWRCHTAFNCVEACPKKINCTDSIQNLKKKAILGKFGIR